MVPSDFESPEVRYALGLSASLDPILVPVHVHNVVHTHLETGCDKETPNVILWHRVTFYLRE